MALRYLLLILFMPLFSEGQTPMYKLLRKKASGCNLLLDSYSGAAVAYSLRQLDCDYAGAAIRVRRSSDDAEQDIGFDNGVLDTDDLVNFVGESTGDDGFIVIWYDQSGNGDNAIQPTAANQPMIMDEGLVLTQGGLPSVQFDGTNDYLYVDDLEINSYMSLYVILRAANSAKPMFTEHSVDAGSNSGFFFYGTNNSPWYVRRSPNGHFSTGVSNWLSSATGSDLALADLQYNGSGAYYANNSAQSNNSETGSDVGNTSTTKDLYIFSRAGSALFTEGYLSEYVLYDSDQTGNRSNIVSNINSFYTIY